MISIPDYIKEPPLPLSVTVIGAGGTGSLFITHLARIAYSAYKLFNVKMAVTIVDGDVVTASNIGRQAFYESDLGLNKAMVSAARINRNYGTRWISVGTHFTLPSGYSPEALAGAYSSNFLISCTDTVESRKEIDRFVKTMASYKLPPELTPYFWMDIGNTKTTGNIIVASPQLEWPSVIDLYGDSLKDSDNGQSCSLAMALNEQDLFINSMCANIAAKWLWECISQTEIDWRGAFVNLNDLNIKKIKA